MKSTLNDLDNILLRDLLVVLLLVFVISSCHNILLALAVELPVFLAKLEAKTIVIFMFHQFLYIT